MNGPRYLHDDYLRHNLMLVRTGRKSRAPGIRRCPDCDEPFIDDHAGLPHCPGCRTAHCRFCKGCCQLIANTTEGDRYCLSCQSQPTLFGTEFTP
jgi:hypothetical protein